MCGSSDIFFDNVLLFLFLNGYPYAHRIRFSNTLQFRLDQ